MKKEHIRAILESAKTIAIIGAKDSPGQPVDRVGRYLIAAGYTILPVHPKRKTVWGIPAYPALTDIPGPVDIVDVFRAPGYCEGHAAEALECSPPPRLFWMQLGITSGNAVSLLAEKGVPVVEDACLMVEHAEMFGRNVLE